ncbi:MAG: T9SS type A sorting domain-containing protein, partial [Candidatus Paceibacterales bacterium]
SYSYNGEDVPDSLNDENHISIVGKTGEDKPEFEKEIDGKNGEKIFVYKRKLPKESEKSKTSLGINHLKVYPNPSPQGKISLSFHATPDAEVTVSITDAKGKEIFVDKKKNFEGEYFNEINLSGKGKGDYVIKISQGDDMVSKKIAVE